MSAAQREENELSFARLDGFFDLAAFAEACIAPSKAEFSPEALERFLNSFQALVRDVAYPDSGAFLRRASVKVGVPAARDGRVFVPVAMLLPDEELELEVSFCWEGEGASARVVDVLFDGDSLVLEYMNQFGAIIDREGVAGLQRKLDAKAEELANKRAEP
ncbi:MAG: ABC transporter substrate-binding protein [Myxococcota bacterium]|nr:ABC transporter substrate-binding protein [Myxococcota bacterium]